MEVWGERVYIPAITGASGITREQAKTALYYAVATHLLPKRLLQMPILAIIGPQGTGKTSLLLQLATMVKGPKMIAAESAATLRDQLADTVTALIDEGDMVKEPYLVKRYGKSTGPTSHNVPMVGGWRTTTDDIFGATVIVRRTPFQDPATSSRAIIIKTGYKEGQYEVKQFAKARANLESVALRAYAGEMKAYRGQKSSDRIRDNWMPLQAIAQYLGDTKWLNYSDEEIERNVKMLMAGQKYEPELALLQVIQEEMFATVGGRRTIIAGDLLISEIRNALKSEFDYHFKNVQIQEMCQGLGLRIVSHSGYPKVKADPELLTRLFKEKQV